MELKLTHGSIGLQPKTPQDLAYLRSLGLDQRGKAIVLFACVAHEAVDAAPRDIEPADVWLTSAPFGEDAGGEPRSAVALTAVNVAGALKDYEE